MFDRVFRRLSLTWVLTCALVFASAFLSGCGPNGNLRAFTASASLMEDLGQKARDEVLAERRTVLDAAAADAMAAGITGAQLQQEIEAAARAWDANGGKRRVELVNGFIAAKDLFVRGVLAAASKEKPSWSEARTLLRDALAAYQALRAVGLERLPEVPDSVVKLVTLSAWPDYQRHPPTATFERRPASAVAVGA